MKILIVDDEEKIRSVIKEYSISLGYEVFESDSGLNALDKLNKYSYDLMILDIMMPEMDGFTMLEKLPKNRRIPTIILSARGEEYDKLQGFELGIDDYVTKPFSPKELMARIKAVSNRYINKNLDTYKYKTLEINFLAHTIKKDGIIVNITPKEFEILNYLIINKNIAISREKLLEKVWGYDFFGDDRTIDTHIKMLRANLGEYRNLIKTVHGIGYKFVEDEEA